MFVCGKRKVKIEAVSRQDNRVKNELHLKSKTKTFEVQL